MAVSMILPIVLLVVLGLIIGLIAAATKVNTSEGGNNVIRNVFIYLVLFATLMMTIGGSVAAFMAVADIIAPVPYHQSFEDFKQWGMEKMEAGKGSNANLSEAEIRARYEAMVKTERERQIDRAKNSLIKSMGWIIIPLPVFIYYQRRLSNREGNIN